MSTASASESPPADVEIAVIGGSGLASLDIEGAANLPPIATPYGVVVGVVVGTLAGRRVAFLARHGAGHRVPPHRINARANLWALASLGARVLLSTNAVGGLDSLSGPGDLVLTDQLIDRTWGRTDTFFDEGSDSDGTGVQHLPFAAPYSAALRRLAAAALRDLGEAPRESGTSVVVQGPRFSTRAEAGWHRAMGATLVNMTQLPEAALAAELGLAHLNIAIVTDSDTEHGDGDRDTSATAERVFRVMAAAQPRLAAAIAAIVAAIPDGYAEVGLLAPEVVSAVLRRPVAAREPTDAPSAESAR